MLRSATIICALFLTAPAFAQSLWPAEPWSAAINLTAIEGAGTNDFHEDLSAAFWNPLSRRLWLGRNGPSSTTSKLWRLKESGAGSWVIDTEGGTRAEWTGFGDFEALTQVDLASNTIFALVETDEVIKQFAVGSNGAFSLQRVWNTRPHLPLNGGLGAEGLAFIPDAHLRAAGFVNPAGFPTVSTRGMGGLMFVGHQNGGRVYVFDLDPASTAFTFVGSFLTGYPETAELFFDRSTGDLFALHSDDINVIEVLSLASAPVGSERRFIARAAYTQPTGTPGSPNFEGLAVFDLASCQSGRRSLFLTVDDGGPNSLFWFRQWPCPCRADFNRSGTVTVQDIFDFLEAYFGNAPAADFNFSGAASVQDIFDLLEAYFAC